MSLIADDSDGHRSRTGHMRYAQADVLRFDNGLWFVANGTAWGAYPADPYDSDIIVHWIVADSNHEALEPQFIDMFRSIVARGKFFRYSVMLGMASGHLAQSRQNRLAERVMKRLKPSIDAMVAHDAQIDEDVFCLSTMCASVTSAAAYRPSAPETLAAAIAATLADPNNER